MIWVLKTRESEFVILECDLKRTILFQASYFGALFVSSGNLHLELIWSTVSVDLFNKHQIGQTVAEHKLPQLLVDISHLLRSVLRSLFLVSLLLVLLNLDGRDAPPTPLRFSFEFGLKLKRDCTLLALHTFLLFISLQISPQLIAQPIYFAQFWP